MASPPYMLPVDSAHLSPSGYRLSPQMVPFEGAVLPPPVLPPQHSSPVLFPTTVTVPFSHRPVSPSPARPGRASAPSPGRKKERSQSPRVRSLSPALRRSKSPLGNASGPITITHDGQYARLQTVGEPLDKDLNVVDARTGQKRSGVGIFFQQESSGWIYVANLLPNSSSALDGRIAIYDELLRVDDFMVDFETPLEDVRERVLGQPGTKVLLGFRRKGAYEGDRQVESDYIYEVELLRGNPHSPPPKKRVQVDFSKYEREISYLRQEIEMLSSKLENFQHDARTANLEAELNARREDMARFETMLERSRERSREAESTRDEIIEHYNRMKRENERLQKQDVERSAIFDDLHQRSVEFQDERNAVMEIEHRLRDANDKLSSLVQESTDMESDHHVFLRQRLHQGHVAIKEAIKAQEIQIQQLNDIIPSLDMVHSSFFSSMALDPAHIHAFQVSPPKLPEVTSSSSSLYYSSSSASYLKPTYYSYNDFRPAPTQSLRMSLSASMSRVSGSEDFA
ncbi:hypothetical protein GUITHDRAFT_100589 [Guillardia theta CCMP2712]|uniref:PDZ domain-containing protein n=1 Tax=Guillardia theta (strain CCMP2712) TaxID=905079 RepID=L1JZH2_GUITC|nr:hypothetical protein GUITHDRAFT_100589 [Guillardia theta CCMP2712]EKX53605.1 hypothetical protein GUITHDRAFT_100589 [Guillardia theta CCMP2712]|eukprot:XP_005840585.1 hypothetical protein GUITHDRAFT_100589 [Guillardia theta CCMP2712]